jgi:hypothetical protein
MSEGVPHGPKIGILRARRSELSLVKARGFDRLAASPQKCD